MVSILMFKKTELKHSRVSVFAGGDWCDSTLTNSTQGQCKNNKSGEPALHHLGLRVDFEELRELFGQPFVLLLRHEKIILPVCKFAMKEPERH